MPGPPKKPLHLSTPASIYTILSDPGIKSNKHVILFFLKISRHSMFFSCRVFNSFVMHQ